MKLNPVVLHCYAEKEYDQWSAVCLDFTLAAQADTLDEATSKLISMIKEYLEDITYGDDKEYADQFLNRRAPFSEWAKYYYYRLLSIFNSKNQKHKSFEKILPISICP